MSPGELAPPQEHLRADARANRERVIAAARTVMAKSGLGVDMRDVAQEAGVGVATVYRTYKTREVMIEAVINDLIDDLTGLIDRAHRITDSRLAIENLLAGTWEMAERHGDIVDALQRGPEQAGAGEHRTRLQARAGALLQRALADGVIRADCPLPYVMANLSSLFTLYLAVRGQIGPEAAAEACAEGFRRAVLTPKSP